MTDIPLLKNIYLKWGLAVLLVLVALLYFAVDNLIMPRVTRHGTEITVPDVSNKSLPEALEALADAGLVFGDSTAHHGTESQQGLVRSQNPRAGAKTKPGRRVHLTIYRGFPEPIAVPDVILASLRDARSDLRRAELIVHPDELPDTTRSPFPDMVTRTEPPAGVHLQKGDTVRIWYGLGLNPNHSVEVPNVAGMQHTAAEQILRPLHLWPSPLGYDKRDNPLITRQSPEPGSHVPQGSTIRLFADSSRVDYR